MSSSVTNHWTGEYSMATDQHNIEFLEGSSYLSFATLKKSGDYVATPVWFAPMGGSYYLFSAEDAGKVKRLRNFSASRVAACTVSGKVTGEWLEATSELLETPEGAEQALTALRDKYGWQMRGTDLMSKLSGKYYKRSYSRLILVDG